MAISIGDVISFIALVVALNAALSALILFVVKRDDRHYQRTVKRLDRNERLAEASVTRAGECIFELDKRIEVNQNQCQRLLLGCSVDSEVKQRIVEAFERLTRISQKNLQELALLSNNVQRRLSAARHLAEIHGDVNSIDVFRLALERETDPDLKPLLKTYLRLLKRRLSE